MFKKRWATILSFFVLLSMILSACAPATPVAVAPTQAQQAAPTATTAPAAQATEPQAGQKPQVRRGATHAALGLVKLKVVMLLYVPP